MCRKLKIFAYLQDRNMTLVAILWQFLMAIKCARCGDKGVGEDLCVQKKICPIFKVFTAEQKQQLSTPTYRAPKEKEHKRLLLLPPH